MPAEHLVISTAVLTMHSPLAYCPLVVTERAPDKPEASEGARELAEEHSKEAEVRLAALACIDSNGCGWVEVTAGKGARNEHEHVEADGMLDRPHVRDEDQVGE